MTPLVQAALDLATEAHAGQYRRDGVTPYINHPIEVARRALELYDAKYTARSNDESRPFIDRDRELLQVVALTHDVVEDCVDKYPKEVDVAQVLFDQHLLNIGEFGQITEALHRLNKHRYPDYFSLILAAKGNWLSSFVKRGDLGHNLSDAPSKTNRDKYMLALYILES